MGKATPNTITIGRDRLKTEYRLIDDLAGKRRDAVERQDEVVLDDEQLDRVIVRVLRREGTDESIKVVTEERQSRDEDTIGDEIAVADLPAGNELLPVYQAGESGEYAMPSGRLFVRMMKRFRLIDRADDLERIGFRIDRVNDWAPHSGWIVADNGDASRALAMANRLSGMLDAIVEPELVSMRHFKPRNRE